MSNELKAVTKKANVENARSILENDAPFEVPLSITGFIHKLVRGGSKEIGMKRAKQCYEEQKRFYLEKLDGETDEQQANAYRSQIYACEQKIASINCDAIVLNSIIHDKRMGDAWAAYGEVFQNPDDWERLWNAHWEIAYTDYADARASMAQAKKDAKRVARYADQLADWLNEFDLHKANGVNIPEPVNGKGFHGYLMLDLKRLARVFSEWQPSYDSFLATALNANKGRPQKSVQNSQDRIRHLCSAIDMSNIKITPLIQNAIAISVNVVEDATNTTGEQSFVNQEVVRVAYEQMLSKDDLYNQ